MSYDKKDGYYRKAKAEGYRSRATYKLKQIDGKFRIIRPGDIVIDLGAAPGGWSQVAVELAGPGNVLAADIRTMEPIEGVLFVRADVTTEDFLRQVAEWNENVDVVLSDMSPDITGHYSMDQARSVHMAEWALEVARKVLKPGGNSVVKVFQGDIFPHVLAEYRTAFSTVKCHSPQASRKASSEVYIVAKGFKGRRD